MPTNDQVILNQLLEQQRTDIAPTLKLDEYFVLFSAEQILKNYNLSYDEIESGIIDKGDDGGIDSIYGFINGELIIDDPDIEYPKQDIVIKLVIIQSSLRKGFSETSIQTLISTTLDLLNLSNDLSKFRKIYNADLIQAIENFKEIYLRLASKHPKLELSYHYTSRGTEIHPKVHNEIAKLKKNVNNLFSNPNYSFQLHGSRELLDLSRQSPSRSLSLKVAENPIATGDDGFICLVKLKDYFNFIADEDTGELQRWMFETNVRDYEGSVEVNKGIRETLQNPGDEDFWWLNNGISIVASSAPFAGKMLTIEDAKVVNGLQTSFEIHKYFKENQDDEDDRNVLIRIVVPKSDMSRNKIIKATNNQTRITPVSLRATDEIQKDIEQYLKTRGLYYERRKNYYKNLGRPKDKIISISFLAQANMAILLQEPNNARGRPTTLIKDDKDYKRVFSSDYPISIYYETTRFMKLVDNYLRTDAPKHAQKDRTNIRFQLAMFAAANKGKLSVMRPQDLMEIGLDEVESRFLDKSLKHVWEIFEGVKASLDLEGDRVAKSKKFDEAVLTRLKEIHGSSKHL